MRKPRLPIAVESERAFQAKFIHLARLYRWRVAHFRPAQTRHGWRTAVQGDGVGFPDLVLVRPPRLLFVELKSDKGKLTHEQMQWWFALHSIRRLEVYCWRPRDWDALVRILE